MNRKMYDNLEEELVKFIDVKNIDILYLASSNFAQFFNNRFPYMIIETLKKIMKNKTIIVPTFSFDFCDTGVYSINNSDTYCGGIASLFLKAKGVERTLFPPMHNVAIWGKLQSRFLNKKYGSSFGEDSIFADLSNYNTMVLLIDCSFDDGVPFVHCLEEKYNSTYRFIKKFNGKIIDKNNNSMQYEFERYVRKRGTILSAEKIGNMFYSSNLVKIKKYEMSEFAMFTLRDFYTFFEPIFENNPNIMEIKNGSCI